jgi:hypothetical protein
MKSLSEVSTFQYAEMMGSNKISAMIRNIVLEKNGTVYLTEENLEDVFYNMRHKSFNFTAKFAVIDLFRKGIIKLIYNEKMKLTVGIPFFKCKLPSGGFGVIINVSNYAKMSDNGAVKIDASILYALMLAGSLSLLNIDSIMASSRIPELYGSLFTNEVSRLVNLDPVNREKIKFIATKFMYIQLGVDELRASNAAKLDVRNLSPQEIEQLDLSFPAISYADLDSLIIYIKKAFPEFTNLTFGSLFDRWMRSYGEASSFAIDYPIFTLVMFIALIVNCPVLVNVKSMEKEVTKQSAKLVMLFSRLENMIVEMSQR